MRVHTTKYSHYTNAELVLLARQVEHTLPVIAQEMMYRLEEVEQSPQELTPEFLDRQMRLA